MEAHGDPGQGSGIHDMEMAQEDPAPSRQVVTSITNLFKKDGDMDALWCRVMEALSLFGFRAFYRPILSGLFFIILLCRIIVLFFIIVLEVTFRSIIRWYPCAGNAIVWTLFKAGFPLWGQSLSLHVLSRLPQVWAKTRLRPWCKLFPLLID